MVKVAWVGLGIMGYSMAGYVAKAGHDVTVYNRTAAKATKWVKAHGGKTAKTPKDAAKGADFVFVAWVMMMISVASYLEITVPSQVCKKALFL